MQISISNVIGNSNSNGYLYSLIYAFKARVATDSGTFEAESCLNTTLTNLNNI